MEKKTYGAHGFMDWTAQLEAGSSKVKVHFTGGTLTQYGVTPAEYTTSNPFFQRIIENSTYFKDGRIQLLRTVTIADPIKAKAPAKEPKAAPQPETTTTETEGAKGEVSETTGTKGEASETEGAETQAETEDGNVIEVTCVQDAQNYLTEQYGIPGYKVRTWESIDAAAAERGITFKRP